jgi:hypothetical protein
MATTTIKAYLDFTNNSAVVTLNAGNSANAGISLAAPNVIEDMWLIAQGTLNFTRVIKGSLSTTQIELQEPWNGTTTANVECRISTSGSSVANLTAAVRALISSSTSIGDHIDDAVGAHAASAIANTPAGGISATTVQGALNELDSEKFDKTGGTVSGATSITSTLKVGANTADVTYASGQPLAAVTNANSRVDIVVRNADSGSSAGAGLVINPHGNSWRMGAGSAARDSNRLRWEIDALGSPVEIMGLGASGGLDVIGNVKAHLASASNSTFRGLSWGVINSTDDFGGVKFRADTGVVRYTAGFSGWGGSHEWYANGAHLGTWDGAGNLQVGMTGVDYHVFRKDVTGDAGNAIFAIIGQSGATSLGVYGVTTWGANTANAALKVGKDSVTGASIRAGGTILASGADAAEYRRNNGLKIAKGQIVAYKHDGTLTLTWSEATMARVKSTDPHIVGGDTWGTEDKIGKRPDEPKFTPPEYTGREKPEGPAPEPQAPTFTLTEPEHPGANASPVEAATYVLLKREYDVASDDHAQAVVAFESAHAAWASLHEQHLRDMADWRTDQVEHETRVAVERDLFDTTIYPEYQRAKAAFEARLEQARQEVDRIAYCGIVPCNVTGATPGHYIVAAEGPNDTITGLSVIRPTEDQWPWVVGRCLRVLPDGRAEIDVMLS